MFQRIAKKSSKKHWKKPAVMRNANERSNLKASTMLQQHVDHLSRDFSTRKVIKLYLQKMAS